MRLWFLLLKSKLNPANKKYEAIAEEARNRGNDLAEKIMSGERMALEDQGLATLFEDKTMLSIELQFLWGVFHELVQEYPSLPVDGFDRIKLHIIERLMNTYGYTFEAARDEAITLAGLYNKADELFDAISDLGKIKFHSPQSCYLPIVVKSLDEAGMGADAYR